MSDRHTFEAAIEQGGGGGAYVTIPFDVEAAFGKKRVPVRVTIDGAPYRGLLVRMGGEHHILPVLKEIRARIGKQAGDRVEVTVQEDTEPKVVVPPADFAAALEAAPGAAAFFDGLAYTPRKEYVQWIESAKREQTRRDRVAKAVEMLAAGKKGR